MRKSQTEKRTMRVYFSDFKDCPGLSARFTNLMSARNIQFVETTPRWIKVEGQEFILDALYRG